jgi:hypothetical protein
MNSDKHTRLVSCPECEHDVYSLEPPELDWEFEADDDDDNWELE